MTEKGAIDQELTKAVKELFSSKYGEFRLEDCIRVVRLLKMAEYKVVKPHKRPMTENQQKLCAEDHLVDIIGIDLRYALDAYKWRECIPMTDDDVIVSGFWNPIIATEIPVGYVLDESKRYLKSVILLI